MGKEENLYRTPSPRLDSPQSLPNFTKGRPFPIPTVGLSSESRSRPYFIRTLLSQPTQSPSSETTRNSVPKDFYPGQPWDLPNE